MKEEELRDPKTKRLVDYIHYFPIGSFISTKALPPYPESWFQLVFDEVGWAGCQDAIRDYYRNDKNIIWDPKKDPRSILFGKSGAIPMLQLADIYAGMMREYVEQLKREDFPPCRVCSIKGIRDCSFKRQRRAVGNTELMKIMYPLCICYDNNKRIDVGIMIRLPEVQHRFLFIDCLFMRRGK